MPATKPQNAVLASPRRGMTIRMSQPWATAKETPTIARDSPISALVHANASLV